MVLVSLLVFLLGLFGFDFEHRWLETLPLWFVAAKGPFRPVAIVAGRAFCSCHSEDCVDVCVRERPLVVVVLGQCSAKSNTPPAVLAELLPTVQQRCCTSYTKSYGKMVLLTGLVRTTERKTTSGVGLRDLARFEGLK